MNNIDKIFVINFNNDNDKWNNCVNQFKTLKIDNYERINCNLINFNSIKKKNYVCFSHNFLKKKKFLDNVENYISFEYSLKMINLDIFKIAKNRNYDQILILEDNFLIKDNFFDNFDNILNEANQNYYGLLYLSNLFKSDNQIRYTDKLIKVYDNHESLAKCVNKRLFDKIIEGLENSKCELDKFFRDNIHKSKMKVNQGKVLNTFIINLQYCICCRIKAKYILSWLEVVIHQLISVKLEIVLYIYLYFIYNN